MICSMLAKSLTLNFELVAFRIRRISNSMHSELACSLEVDKVQFCSKAKVLLANMFSKLKWSTRASKWITYSKELLLKQL